MLGMLKTNMGNVNLKNESNPICYIDFRYCFLDHIHVYVNLGMLGMLRTNMGNVNLKGFKWIKLTI